MEPGNSIHDALKHARSIHFSLVAVSFIILYLVVSAWTDSPEVVEELTTVERTTQSLADGGLDFIEQLLDKKILQEVITLYEKEIPGIKIDDAQKGAILRKSVSLKPNDRGTPWPKLEYSSLQKWRDTLERYEWKIIRISSVTISQDIKKQMSAWAKEETGFKPMPHGGISGAGPFLMDLKISGTRLVDGHGELELVLGVSKMHSYSGKGEIFFTDLPPVQKSFRANFTTTPDKIALPDGWFPFHFPRLTSNVHWDDLKQKTIPQAIKSLEKEKADKLGSKEQKIFSISISGPDIGYVGPIVIGTILLYLSAYISHVRRYVEKKAADEKTDCRGFFSPWIGTMQGVLPLFLTAITLIVVPVLSAWLVVWRVLNRETMAGAIASMYFLIGAYCAYQGSRISKVLGDGRGS